MAKRKVLGKGLSALIPEETAGLEGAETFFYCPVERIRPNPYQPRQDFSEKELQEMAASVRQRGILTPLLVARRGDQYQLIAGERRWRAAQKAGLERVPVFVREANETESLELALIENIHRKDLNPIEEAQAYRRLLEEIGLTQEALAERVGRERSSIANLLRLLTLPKSIQKDVIDGRLTMGHARVLVGLKDLRAQMLARDLVISKGLSVRELERHAQRQRRGRQKPAGQLDVYMASLEERLQRSLGTKVKIHRRGKQGRIVLHFFTDEDLERLLERLS